MTKQKITSQGIIKAFSLIGKILEEESGIVVLLANRLEELSKISVENTRSISKIMLFLAKANNLETATINDLEKLLKRLDKQINKTKGGDK